MSRYAEILSLLQTKWIQRQEKAQKYDWEKQARSNQRLPEGNWLTWLILAGRGFGKTRTGAETIRQWVHSGRYGRLALIARSISEGRRIMVEGESGLLAVHPSSERPIFEASKRQLTWKNGAIATLFGADHYEQLRGPQFDGAWIDELAKFRQPEEAWNQLLFGLRLGKNPRCLITTTPRPIPFLEKLLKDPSVTVTRGTTFDNQANLAPDFIDQIVKQFQGTSMGAQELYAELLTERQGALWSRKMIRYNQPSEDSAGKWELERIVIAVDPATTHHEGSDETGIVVVGIDAQKQGYVLEDLSARLSPGDWGQRVVNAYWRYRADRVVAEVNKGGDLVERILRAIDPAISYKAVRATRGKATRAEPVAALYEQNRIYHVRPFTDLETQLCDYIPGITSKSPDRLDALVWAVTDLLLQSEMNPILKVWGV